MTLTTQLRIAVANFKANPTGTSWAEVERLGSLLRTREERELRHINDVIISVKIDMHRQTFGTVYA